MSILPTRVLQSLEDSKNVNKPVIYEYMVSQKIKISKNTRGGVPGDLPIRLAKEFGPELAAPATKIFNNIVQTGKWPDRWKEERGIPLNKVKPNQPQNEGQLRIISLTPFLSKTLERIIMDWLLEYEGDKLDWSQFGGRKGSSCNHYLVDMITYIQYNQDLKEPKAILAAMIDFEKAFNRQNHHILLTKLHDMNVPGWLLNVVKGFLENRKLIVNYKGKDSTSKDMPGGGPQGTLLGLFLFLILINDAGFKNDNVELGKKITANVSKRKEISTNHWKYVDDLTLGEAIDLKKCLQCDTGNILVNPPRYHDRTHHNLPQDKSQVQEKLNNISN
jgi:hypothetical protein